MEYRFYIGEGEPARTLIGEVLASGQYAGVYRDALIEQTGADNLVFFSHFPGKPQGLVFNERKEIPGLKMGAPTVTTGFAYFPDLATEEGKKLQGLLFDKRLEFDAEQMLLNELGLQLEVVGYCDVCRNVHAKFRSHAFIIDGIPKVFAQVPVVKEIIPMPPDWMKEVKESEWLAAQGK